MLPRKIAAQVASDAKQPRPLAVLLLVGAFGLHDADEHSLREVFGLLPRVGHPQQIAIERQMMALEQLGRRGWHSCSFTVAWQYGPAKTRTCNNDDERWKSQTWRGESRNR